MSDAKMMLFVLAGMTAGNFVYQAAGHEEWAVAFERSFFQTTAIVLCIVVLWVRHRVRA